MTREEKLSRDISAIRKSLQSIAEDLRYFRKKDEEAPTHTCKNCVHYRRKLTRSYNYIFHWCDHQDCSISECGLNHPCDDFKEDES